MTFGHHHIGRVLMGIYFDLVFWLKNNGTSRKSHLFFPIDQLSLTDYKKYFCASLIKLGYSYIMTLLI
jgi:hypothetical protein